MLHITVFSPDPFKVACDQGWHYFNGSCYQLNDGQQAIQTHARAQTICRSWQAYLVNIESQEENDFVARLAPATDIWIGYTDAGQEGTWKWTNNARTSSYTNWAKRQPDNHGNADCALIWGSRGKPFNLAARHVPLNRLSAWDDQRCSERKPFVCEKGE